jgi:hypothetical protein
VPSPTVDLVFVIDASASMAPCFDQVRRHLRDVITPLQGHVSHVNFALVAAAASRNGDGILYKTCSLLDADHGRELVSLLYAPGADPAAARERFFTSDPDRLTRRLDQLTAEGDEDMLVALDIALDLPFGPVASTKRVVALFSDEPFEDGVSGSGSNARLPDLIEKIQRRHVHLFAAVPDGPAATQLAAIDRAEIELVGTEGRGLAEVDFGQLFSQMGRSISVSSVQLTSEPAFRRALFGQDQWGAADGEMAGR